LNLRDSGEFGLQDLARRKATAEPCRNNGDGGYCQPAASGKPPNDVVAATTRT
jgi:hypothetical protein